MATLIGLRVNASTTFEPIVTRCVETAATASVRVGSLVTSAAQTPATPRSSYRRARSPADFKPASSCTSTSIPAR